MNDGVGCVGFDPGAGEELLSPRSCDAERSMRVLSRVVRATPETLAPPGL